MVLIQTFKYLYVYNISEYMNLIPNKRLTVFLNEFLKSNPDYKKIVKHKKHQHIEISEEARNEIQIRVAKCIIEMLDIRMMRTERRNTILKRDLNGKT